MAFQIGDRVRVIADISDELPRGTETTILNIWEGQEHPYELEGFFEYVQEGEIKRV